MTDKPFEYGKGLPKRLRIKAGMISMGERIAWGSDSDLMYEAADRLEKAKELLMKAAYSLGDRALPDSPDHDLFQEIDLFLENDDE